MLLFSCAIINAGGSLGSLAALRWAKSAGFGCVQILTDSLEVIKALCDVSASNVIVRNIIRDILDLISSSFCFVKCD